MEYHFAVKNTWTRKDGTVVTRTYRYKRFSSTAVENRQAKIEAIFQGLEYPKFRELFSARDLKILERCRTGITYKEAGLPFGLTGARVCQIVEKARLAGMILREKGKQVCSR